MPPSIAQQRNFFHVPSGAMQRDRSERRRCRKAAPIAVLNGVTGTTLTTLVNAGQIDFWLS
jgi:hypothetical protein